MTRPVAVQAPPAGGAVDDTRRLLAQLRGQAGEAGAPRMPRQDPRWADAAAPARRRGVWATAGAATVALALGAWHLLRADGREQHPPAAAAANVSAPVQPQPAAARSMPGVMLEASGFVVARRQATVSASQTGRLARLYVTEGATVRRGDLIAELDAGISRAEVAHAQAGVAAAERAVEVTRRKLEAARRNAARDQGLARDGFISAAGLDQSTTSVETLQAQLEAELSQVAVSRERQRIQLEQMQGIQVRAPFDGVVTGLAANVGEIVSPVSGGGGFTRTGICTIVDPSSVEGEVDVNERYLERLRPGQAVQVRLPAYPSLTVKGTVAALPAVIDRNTAAARIRITFPAPIPELRPGMRADFAFEGV